VYLHDEGLPTMTKTDLRSVTLALGILAGCMDTNNAIGHLEFSWKVELASGSSAACPDGYGSAALYSQPLDSSNNPIGKPNITEVDCSAGAGTTPALEPGDYNSWVEIEDKASGSGAAQSPTSLELNGAPLVMGTSDLTVAEQVVLDGGFFRYEWSVVGATSGSAVACDVNGANSFLLTATSVMTSTDVYTASTPCSIDSVVHFALSNPIPTGLYTVTVVANNGSGSAVGPPTTLENQTIQAASALQPVTDMGNVTVEVNGM
jgi:hypothetical protein